MLLSYFDGISKLCQDGSGNLTQENWLMACSDSTYNTKDREVVGKALERGKRVQILSKSGEIFEAREIFNGGVKYSQGAGTNWIRWSNIRTFTVHVLATQEVEVNA
jgi:hypothetical protein